jgi:hypothetical protein
MELAELLGLFNARGFETVSKNVTAKQMRLLGRVPQANMSNWLVAMDYLLAKGETAAWTLDISKQYFRRNGRLLFAWRIILQSDDVAKYYDDLGEAVRNSPKARATVETYTLHGAGPNRNSMRDGKGVQGALNAVVGAQAVRR